METLRTARAEMAKIVADKRIRTEMRHHVPAAADPDVRISNPVLWFRDKPLGRWTGPFFVVGQEGTFVWIDNGDRRTIAPIDRVRWY